MQPCGGTTIRHEEECRGSGLATDPLGVHVGGEDGRGAQQRPAQRGLDDPLAGGTVPGLAGGQELAVVLERLSRPSLDGLAVDGVRQAQGAFGVVAQGLDVGLEPLAPAGGVHPRTELPFLGQV